MQSFNGGSLPSVLGGLGALTYLSLSNACNFAGAVPPSLGSLSHMASFTLSMRATGALPPAFGSLGGASLTYLNVKDGTITGVLPANSWSSLTPANMCARVSCAPAERSVF